VSVIDVATRRERRVGFASLNGRREALRRAGVRIFGPNATVAQDLEPEFVAVADDGREAYVTLQENNALAIIDLRGAAPRLDRVVPLGFKDHGRDGNALDVSDEDGEAGNLETYRKLFGVYQPDGVAFARIGGRGFLLLANEGDAREYDTFAEEARVGDLRVAPRFPEDELARLTVTTTLGRDAAGVYRELHAFGGRSFSVRDTDGRLVFDSGDAIERLLAERFPALLDDTRSDNKGPEPENVAAGVVDGRTLAFVGLERANAVIVFDVSAPRRPAFAGLLSREGDVGPEGLDFVPAAESPTGRPLLLVANEVSSGTTAFELRPAR
jgi:2',3'-cyclic-nucleotide 2'-phosphodiesterase / 3'-nucleotidase / 5'-nucleotidase